MPQTNLGRVAFKFQGDYSALTTYAKYDVVFDGESSFVSQIDNNLGNELVDGLNWKYLAKGNNLSLQDLKQDVTDLETNLNTLDAKVGTTEYKDVNLNWRVNGTAIDVNGNVSSIATYGIRSYALRVFKDDIIYISGKIPYSQLSKIALTDLNETYYNSVVNYSLINTDEETYWKCPSDCLIVITSSSVVPKPIVKIKSSGILYDVEEIKEDILDIQNFNASLDIYSQEQSNVDISDATPGYYTISGAQTGGTPYLGKLLEVSNAIEVYYTGHVKFSTTSALRFFDKNMLNIGNYLVGTSTEVSYINEKVIIPSETKYIAVTFFGSYNNSIVITNNVIYSTKNNDISLQSQIDLITKDGYDDFVFPKIYGKYIDSNGNLAEQNIYWTTGWVSVEGLSSVIYNGMTQWSVMHGVMMIDADGVLYRYINGTGTATWHYGEVINAPNKNIVSVAFTFLTAGAEEYRWGKIIGNKIVGVNYKANYKQNSEKGWLSVGDSLTQVNTATSKRYYEYINERLGFSIINRASGGVGYARLGTDNNNFTNQVNTTSSNNVGLITIFGSGNDKGAGIPIGTATDTGTSTLGGYINDTITAVHNKFPLVPFGIITPTPWKDGEPNDSGDYAQWFKDYSLLIVDICKLRGVPCLDLYRCSNLHPTNIYFRALAYKYDGIWKKVTDTSVIDPYWVLITNDNITTYQALSDDVLAVGDYVQNDGGIHPDEDGHRIIASRIKGFIESLIL